ARATDRCHRRGRDRDPQDPADPSHGAFFRRAEAACPAQPDGVRASPMPASSRLPSRASAMARAHLLVVDDEPSILTTLQKALSLEGYAVDVAGGVKVAEEKLKKRAYDLCLFDVQLPDGDGVDLLQRLRTAKSETPV